MKKGQPADKAMPRSWARVSAVFSCAKPRPGSTALPSSTQAQKNGSSEKSTRFRHLHHGRPFKGGGCDWRPGIRPDQLAIRLSEHRNRLDVGEQQTGFEEQIDGLMRARRIAVHRARAGERSEERGPRPRIGAATQELDLPVRHAAQPSRSRRAGRPVSA